MMLMPEPMTTQPRRLTRETLLECMLIYLRQKNFHTFPPELYVDTLLKLTRNGYGFSVDSLPEFYVWLGEILDDINNEFVRDPKDPGDKDGNPTVFRLRASV